MDVYRRIGYANVKVTLDQEKAKSGCLVYVIEEGPRIRIRAVRFTGDKHFPSHVLKTVLKTKERRWLVMPSYYTAEAVSEDVETLRQFYYQKGYLGYDIFSEQPVFSQDRRFVTITFHIDAGSLYHVGRIVFEGAVYFTPAQLQDMVQVAPGQVYLKKKIDNDAKAIEREYRELGFMDVQVTQRPRYQPEDTANVVTVAFIIHEGRQFRVGRIEVTGNDMCQDRVVRRVLDEYGFTPGELYNANMAHGGLGPSKLERYVKSATLAEEVLIVPVEPQDGSPDRKDVQVDLTEGLTGLFMPGIGVSSDSGVIGHIIFQQSNFDIADVPETWSDFFLMRGFRGAGQNLRIALEPGTEVSQYTISFSDPYFRDRPIGLDLAARSYERWLESYNEKRGMGHIGFEFRRGDAWRQIFNTQVKNVAVQEVDVDAPQEIRNVRGNNNIVTLQVGTGLKRVDDMLTPTSGYSLRLAYEQALGDFDYGIATGGATRYITLYEDVFERRSVLSARLRAGHVVGDAPPFEKFYGGGMGQYGIRGFDYRGVSTRGLQVFEDGTTGQYVDPIGCDWILLADAEIMIPLIGDKFSMVTFVDSGWIDTGGTRLSAGAGIQIIVPQVFGPVPMRFEYGIPIEKDPLDDVRRFNFSMGQLF
jgi:outer membrane protein insertion porin family